MLLSTLKYTGITLPFSTIELADDERAVTAHGGRFRLRCIVT